MSEGITRICRTCFYNDYSWDSEICRYCHSDSSNWRERGSGPEQISRPHPVGDKIPEMTFENYLNRSLKRRDGATPGDLIRLILNGLEYLNRKIDGVAGMLSNPDFVFGPVLMCQRMRCDKCGRSYTSGTEMYGYMDADGYLCFNCVECHIEKEKKK